jgi:hypothetical protein
MVDDKLAIAGELTRQEVVEYINPLRAWVLGRNGAENRGLRNPVAFLP